MQQFSKLLLLITGLSMMAGIISAQETPGIRYPVLSEPQPGTSIRGNWQFNID